MNRERKHELGAAEACASAPRPWPGHVMLLAELSEPCTQDAARDCRFEHRAQTGGFRNCRVHASQTPRIAHRPLLERLA